MRRWEAEGKLVPERTASGHRRYDLSQLLGIKSELSFTVAYARVSSHDQKADLERQKQVLELFCATNGWLLTKFYRWQSHTVNFAQFQMIEDLATDVLEIITVFSACLYGSRSHKNKKIVEELRSISEKL